MPVFTLGNIKDLLFHAGSFSQPDVVQPIFIVHILASVNKPVGWLSEKIKLMASHINIGYRMEASCFDVLLTMYGLTFDKPLTPWLGTSLKPENQFWIMFTASGQIL
jgi:hypothetical protein